MFCLQAVKAFPSCSNAPAFSPAAKPTPYTPAFTPPWRKWLPFTPIIKHLSMTSVLQSCMFSHLRVERSSKPGNSWCSTKLTESIKQRILSSFILISFPIYSLKMCFYGGYVPYFLVGCSKNTQCLSIINIFYGKQLIIALCFLTFLVIHLSVCSTKLEVKWKKKGELEHIQWAVICLCSLEAQSLWCLFCCAEVCGSEQSDWFLGCQMWSCCLHWDILGVSGALILDMWAIRIHTKQFVFLAA